MKKVDKEIDILKNVLSEIVEFLEKRSPYAHALFTAQEGLAVNISKKETLVNQVPSRRGVVLSVFNGEAFYEAGTNDISPENLKRTAERLLERTPRAPITINLFPGEAWETEYFSSFCKDPGQIQLSEKIDYLSGICDFVAAEDTRVVSAMLRYSELWTKKLFINRTRRLYQELLSTTCLPVAIVSDGNASKILRCGNARQAGFENTRIPRGELSEMVSTGIRLLKARPVPPGVYDIITGPGLSGVIAHEAFGHGVEADMFVKRRARAADFIGKPVASPIVNLYDAPGITGQSGSYMFDDEGWQAGKTGIVENGVLKRVITDHLSAAKLNLPRTANGRRESYAHKVYARMTNTYFGHGDSKLDDMIASIDNGLYMPKGSNGMEDPKNWGLQAESPFALEIKKGKLTGRMFAPIVITGFVPDILKSISMVGDTLDFEGVGVCQKGHKEQVRVAIGGPHLKLKALVG